MMTAAAADMTTAAVEASSSLLSKYTKLTSSITSTRQSIESTEHEISHLKSAIQELKESGKEMEKHFLRSLEESNIFLSKRSAGSNICTISSGSSSDRPLHHSNSDAFSVTSLSHQSCENFTTRTTTSATSNIPCSSNDHINQQEYNFLQQVIQSSNHDNDDDEYKRLTQIELDLIQELQSLEQDVARQKAHRAQQRQEFLLTCREFRMRVKRGRISLERLKLQKGTSPSLLLRNQQQEQQVEEEKDEIELAREKKNESELILARVQESLSSFKKKKCKMDKDACDRVKNLQQQRKHLERVRSVVTEMEAEIHNLEESSKEYEEISNGYAKGMYDNQVLACS